MNDDFDRLIRDALSGEGQYNPQTDERVRSEVTQMYDSKLKRIFWYTWAVLIIDMVLLIGLVPVFLLINDVKMQIGCAAAWLAIFVSAMQEKTWYWQMNSKLKTLKEISELKVQVAQLSQKLEPRGPTDEQNGRAL
jgi:hypothetical protein